MLNQVCGTHIYIAIYRIWFHLIKHNFINHIQDQNSDYGSGTNPHFFPPHRQMRSKSSFVMKSELAMTTKRVNLHKLTKRKDWSLKKRGKSLPYLFPTSVFYALNPTSKQCGAESHPVVWVGSFYFLCW